MKEYLNMLLGMINWAGWLSAIAAIAGIVYATASSKRDRNIRLIDKRQCYLQRWERLVAAIQKSIDQASAGTDDGLFNSLSFAIAFGERIEKEKRGEGLRVELRRLREEVGTGRFIFEDMQIHKTINCLECVIDKVVRMTPVEGVVMETDITPDCKFLSSVQDCVVAMDNCVGIMKHEMSLIGHWYTFYR